MKTGEKRCFLLLKQENQINRNGCRFHSYRQIVAIRFIARDLGWSKDHLKNWLKKYVKVASIAELDRQGARKAFFGLPQFRKHLGEKVLKQN
jgi:hypothetical protein